MYVGVVDFLQDWTFNKKVERAAKIYMLRKDPEGLSVMEPIAYKQRFQRKMVQIFDVDETLNTASKAFDIDMGPTNNESGEFSPSSPRPFILRPEEEEDSHMPDLERQSAPPALSTSHSLQTHGTPLQTHGQGTAARGRGLGEEPDERKTRDHDFDMT